MAKNNNLNDFLLNTADAIRSAEGSTGLINPQDFESRILNLGGGSAPNGKIWTESNGVSNSKLHYANGLWCTRGGTGTNRNLIYSKDGKIWLTPSTNIWMGRYDYDDLYDLKYFKNAWLILIRSGVYRSTDGNTWTRVCEASLSQDYFGKGNPYFVLGGNKIAWRFGPMFYYSEDGINWIYHENSYHTFGNIWGPHLIYYGDIWHTNFATFNYNEWQDYGFTSPVLTPEQDNPLILFSGYIISSGGDYSLKCAQVGNGGIQGSYFHNTSGGRAGTFRILNDRLYSNNFYSYDGYSFFSLNYGNSASMDYGKDVYVSANGYTPYYSIDGVNFIASNITISQAFFKDVKFRNGIWVAVASSNSTAVPSSSGAYYSLNGIDWSPSNLIGITNIVDVDFNNGIWVLTGTNGKIYYSEGF